MATTVELSHKFAPALLCVFVCLGLNFILQVNDPTMAQPVADAAQAGFGTPTPEPTSTPPTNSSPQIGLDLKSELYLFLGGGGPTGCPPPAFDPAHLPTIFAQSGWRYGFNMNSGLDLCIVGLPTANGDSLSVTLFDAADNFVASRTFVIEKVQPEAGKVLTNDPDRTHIGDVGKLRVSFGGGSPAVTDYIRINLSILPALPREGYWVIESPGNRIQSEKIEILPEFPGIVIRKTNELFSETTCNPTAPGDPVRFVGINMPPNRTIPFGLYRNVLPGPQTNRDRAVLVSSQFLYSNSAGQLDASIQIPYGAPRGTYFLVAVLNPEEDTDAFAGAHSCVWTVDPSLAHEPPPVSGFETSFYETFDGPALEPVTWDMDNTLDYVSVHNGVLQMSGYGNRFPLIHTTHSGFPFFGDFRAEVRFRYPAVETCGVGIMMTSQIPTAGLSQNESGAQQQEAEKKGVAIGVWQDRSGMQLWYRSGLDRRDIKVRGIDTNIHTLAVDYSRNQYRLYLDGALKYTSAPTVYRPQWFWIGNPVDLGKGASCNWDTLQVDQIRVMHMTVASPGQEACAIPVAPGLYGAWSRPGVAARLGCPLGHPYQTASAEEGFQGGSVLWHERDDRIYALYTGGTWASFPDTFVEEVDPMFACGTPSSPPSPVRGFAKLWCGNVTVRANLGYAIEPEIGYCVQGGEPCELFQDFARGMIYASRRQGAVITLFNDGTWLR